MNDRQYTAATRTSITVQPNQLNFKNNAGNKLELYLQPDGKLQIVLMGRTVRMSQVEVQLIRDLIK